jgi:hypothetical protein
MLGPETEGGKSCSTLTQLSPPAPSTVKRHAVRRAIYSEAVPRPHLPAHGHAKPGRCRLPSSQNYGAAACAFPRSGFYDGIEAVRIVREREGEGSAARVRDRGWGGIAICQGRQRWRWWEAAASGEGGGDGRERA